MKETIGEVTINKKKTNRKESKNVREYREKKKKAHKEYKEAIETTAKELVKKEKSTSGAKKPCETKQKNQTNRQQG